jgi:hypothetical protein
MMWSTSTAYARHRELKSVSEMMLARCVNEDFARLQAMISSPARYGSQSTETLNCCCAGSQESGVAAPSFRAPN